MAGRVAAAVSDLEGGPEKVPRLLAPPGMEIPAGGGENFEAQLDEDPKFNALMNAIQTLSVNVNSQFNLMGESLENLRTEVATMKADMVSNEIFQKLENRVAQLESGKSAPEAAELARLLEQVARLDPANRALRVSGFASNDLSARKAKIETMLSDFQLPAASHIEQLTKGQGAEKVSLPFCLVESPSRNIRESALHILSKETGNHGLTINRAKHLFSCSEKRFFTIS